MTLIKGVKKNDMKKLDSCMEQATEANDPCGYQR